LEKIQIGIISRPILMLIITSPRESDSLRYKRVIPCDMFVLIKFQLYDKLEQVVQ